MNAPVDYDGPVFWKHDKSRSVVTARPRRYKGREFIDVREYLKGDGGECGKPTGKGVTMPLDGVASLAAALSSFVNKTALARPETD